MSQQHNVKVCAYGNGFLILSHSRLAFPIPVPELHHSHSHGIPMGKWEARIRITRVGRESAFVNCL